MVAHSKRNASSASANLRLNRKACFLYFFMICALLVSKVASEDIDKSIETGEIKDLDYFSKIVKEMAETAMAIEKLKSESSMMSSSAEQDEKVLLNDLVAKRSLADLFTENGKKKFTGTNLPAYKVRTLNGRAKNLNKTALSSSDLERHRNMLRVIFSYGK